MRGVVEAGYTTANRVAVFRSDSPTVLVAPFWSRLTQWRGGRIIRESAWIGLQARRGRGDRHEIRKASDNHAGQLERKGMGSSDV